MTTYEKRLHETKKRYADVLNGALNEVQLNELVKMIVDDEARVLRESIRKGDSMETYLFANGFTA